MIKVILVEDNPIFREGIAAFLNATDGYSCTRTFESYEQLLNDSENLKADVLISDINLPGISGIEGIKKVKKILPAVKIIMLTVYEDDNRIFDALIGGASGYLSKKTPPAKIIDAIKEVYEGGSPMNSDIASKVINLLRTKNTNNHIKRIELTEKEKVILEGLAKGNNYQLIAEQLLISKHTVRYHIKNIYEKLHATSQTEAVAKAYKNGLLK